MKLDQVVASCIPETGPLASYMRWAIQTTDAEHLFHLGSILPCIANQAVEAGFTIDVERRMRPAVWTFLVGVPASSKSTAQKRGQGLYKMVRNTLAGTLAPDPFVMAEGSVPGLFEALEERYNPDLGMSAGVIIRDEAGRLLSQRDDSVADMLCNIIDGEEVKRHLRSLKAEARATGQTRDTLRNPAFSGCLATTFARLREVTQASHIEGGLYSRFLWFVGQPCLPNPKLHVDLHRVEQARVLNEWVDWGRWLIAQQVLEEDRVVSLTSEAQDVLEKELFVEFVTHARTDSRLNATRKRGLSQAVIIAGLYALSQERLAVNADDMQRATRLVGLSTQGLSDLDSTLAVAREVAEVERVYTAITQTETDAGTTKSTIYRQVQLPKRDLDMAIEMLIAQNRIEQVTEAKAGRGRPSERLRTTARLARRAAILAMQAGRPGSDFDAGAPSLPQDASEAVETGDGVLDDADDV